MTIGQTFMRYYRYATDTGVLALDNYQEFVRVFELSLSGVPITWFRGIKDRYQTIPEFKAAFLGRFNRWGQTVKQLSNAWNTLRFDMQKNDLDSFTIDLRLLGDILHMTPEQTLEKFKDSFDSEISAHLLEADDIETAKNKAQQLIFLYQNKQGTTASTTMLLHEAKAQHEVLEHQLAERSTYDQDKDNSNKSQHPDNCSRHSENNQSYNNTQPNKYNVKGTGWRGANSGNTFRGRSSNRSRYNHPRGRGGYHNVNNQYRQDDQQQNYQRPYGFRRHSGGWQGRSSQGRPPRRNNYRNYNTYDQPQGLGHPSYKGIPQHRYVCSLCSNHGHYDHQCHYAQQVMNHATAASIRAQQVEDAAYNYVATNNSVQGVQDNYPTQQPQTYDTTNNANPNL